MKVSGAVTATSFVGDGSGLTNIPAGQLTGILPVLDGSNLFGVIASGTGIIVKDDGSTVGTAGTIDFGSNLSVTFASGIATVTASIAGINTSGTSTFNELSISGVSTFQNDTYFQDSTHHATNPTKAYFGSLDEMSIFSTGTYLGNSYNYIDANSGYLDIRNLRTTIRNPETSTQRDLAIFDATTFNSEFVKLYYGGNEKFATTTNGVSISGIITAVSGIVTYYGDTSNTVDGRWTLTGDGSNYTLSGIGITSGNNTDPILYFARGRVYEFVNTQPVSHPFVIRDSDGGTEWTAGVSTSTDGTNDILRFEVPMNAPNTLYYQCTVHSGMGNTINVYPTVS